MDYTKKAKLLCHPQIFGNEQAIGNVDRLIDGDLKELGDKMVEGYWAKLETSGDTHGLTFCQNPLKYVVDKKTPSTPEGKFRTNKIRHLSDSAVVSDDIELSNLVRLVEGDLSHIGDVIVCGEDVTLKCGGVCKINHNQETLSFQLPAEHYLLRERVNYKKEFKFGAEVKVEDRNERALLIDYLGYYKMFDGEAYEVAFEGDSLGGTCIEQVKASDVTFL